MFVFHVVFLSLTKESPYTTYTRQGCGVGVGVGNFGKVGAAVINFTSDYATLIERHESNLSNVKNVSLFTSHFTALFLLEYMKGFKR